MLGRGLREAKANWKSTITQTTSIMEDKYARHKKVTLYAVHCVDIDTVKPDCPKGLLGEMYFPTKAQAEAFALAVKSDGYGHYSERDKEWDPAVAVPFEFVVPQTVEDMAQFKFHGWEWHKEIDVFDWTQADEFLEDLLKEATKNLATA